MSHFKREPVDCDSGVQCPHCGAEYTDDLHSITAIDSPFDCDACGKTCMVRGEWSVTYTSTPITEPT